jgi:hypothetical protein
VSGRHRAADRHRLSRPAAAVLTLLLAFTLWPAQGAQARVEHRTPSLTNAARLDNHRDGSYRDRLEFSVGETRRRSVQPVNLAIAVAHCTRCRTIAVAFQVLLVSGPSRAPDAGTPTAANVVAVNQAVALNDHCVACDTVALAYQFVVVDSRSVALTQAGRQQLRDIRLRLRDLMRVPPSDDAFQARVAALAAQVQQVLADNVGPRRSGRSVAPDREVRSEVD